MVTVEYCWAMTLAAGLDSYHHVSQGPKQHYFLCSRKICGFLSISQLLEHGCKACGIYTPRSYYMSYGIETVITWGLVC
jgi:hypothetical protein